MQVELLKLFNAIHVEEPDKTLRKLSERSVKNGYILQPAIDPTDELLDSIESVVGISGEKANASFHKSWFVVKDTPMETLIIQQIIHYITTYGFEALGIYSEQTVYIPNEVLELPEVTDDIPLTVIKAMNAQEILDAIVSLGSGIALAQEALDCIMTIVEYFKYELVDPVYIEQIGNRELKALLYDYYGIVPSDPEEFLRHLISKLTDESLLIKNDYLIGKVKEANGKFLDELLRDAPDNLAEIFFRFKPLFLAMKSISRNKTYFNRLRKQANTLHKPLSEDYLNSITAQIKRGELNLLKLRHKLTNANIFRKIRLAYALNYRLFHEHSIVYRVRNGRGWVAEFEWSEKWGTRDALDLVLTSIAQDISKNVEGKTIYIPEHVHYILPATEKQFTGHLPTGTYVGVPQDLIVGIHWFNTGKRVDLDLSVIGETGKIGWDASYRTDGVLFSGDVTTAPELNGASELFYLDEGESEARLLMVNFYNFEKGDTVDCKILAASEKPGGFGKNYMVDVNNLVATANITISKKQNILGLVSGNRVYFANVSIGNAITSSSSEQATQARKYLMASLENPIELRDVLEAAGANVVDEKLDDGDYVDLSIEALDKSTIIDLVK